MEKNQYESTEEDETIINNSFTDTNSVFEDNIINPKIILFITEYMSLSLKEKISRYLLNNKIRSIKNPITSDTLFHYLCMNDDNYPLINLMKPNSYEKEQKNNLGQTLLHISVQNKSYKILDYLLENGSNINSKDNKNNTILHMATAFCDNKSINIILKYNPNISILNIYNETPFDIAIKMKNKDIINILKKHINEKKKYLIFKNKNNCEKKFIKNKNIEKNNKSSIFSNISINNCSLDTKNETNNQSFNIYKKKIVTNNSKFSFEDSIKNNKTVNLNTSLNDNTFHKNYSCNYYCSLSPKLASKFVYRKTSPKSINNQYTLIEFDDDSEKVEYTPKQKYISQQKYNEFNNNIEYFNYKSERSNYNYISQKNIFFGNNIDLNENSKITNKTRNNYTPIHLINNFDNTNFAIKEIRKTVVNESPFSFYKNNFRKEDICKQKLLQFLKEIGMINYGNILISEGFDDIDLILKQMDEGFPELDDTLKEIGIIHAGDRAKILIRLQEISNEFNFNFPFEEVYFKNNNSIKKWLDSIQLSQYNKNFIDAGYQSFELLLIQMASKYKLNENILDNDLFIFNDKDKKIILKSLIINSEKYIKELRKKGNIQRTYSKIVKKDSDSICLII